MKKKQIKIIITVIIILIITFFLITFIQKNKEKSFTIVMAGDTLVMESLLNYAYDKVNFIYKFDNVLVYLKEYIKDYDLAFYNQETPISGLSLGISPATCFNTPSNFAIDMMNAGFNMISLANNHSLDGKINTDENGNVYCNRNEEGVINNINFWEKYIDVYATGIYRNKEEKENIKIKQKNGIKYALLSYTYGTNMDGHIDYNEDMINIYSDELAKRDINKIRDKVDVLFVSMHWGEEYNHIPNKEQKEQAKYLASLGVDVIIGTHPHVIQPIEWIDNTLVIYSLGNLISSQNNIDDYNRLIGLLVGLKVTKKNNKIIIENVSCELTNMHYEIIENTKTNFMVIPFSYINKNNSKYLNLYNKYSKIIKMYDENIKINNIGTKKMMFDKS